MTALETSLANTPTEFVIEQPRRPIWHEMRSPRFSLSCSGALCAPGACGCGDHMGADKRPVLDLFALSAAISLVVLMLRGDLRMRMVPDLTRYVPRVCLSNDRDGLCPDHR